DHSDRPPPQSKLLSFVSVCLEMASNLSLLSEDQLLCSICLDLFTQPVTTPCGHNFCMSCLTSYWNSQAVCQCPICKETFENRPNLRVNTFISELMSQFTLLQVNSDGVVLCDVCTDDQQKAVKSCFDCLTSYCSPHLEHHYRAAGLKRHTLCDPVVNLEDRICKEHHHLLTVFCSDDRKLLCDLCVTQHAPQHADHSLVPVQQAYVEMKNELMRRDFDIQKMIEERQQRVKAMKESVEQSRKDSKDMIIQENQEQLKTILQLRELTVTQDRFTFLQKFKSSSFPVLQKNLPKTSFYQHLEVRHMQKYLSRCMSQLQVLVNKMTSEINTFSVSDNVTLRYLQQYEVNVVLDPNTANPHLILSNDMKQVRYNVGAGLWLVQDLKPNMFITHLAVLGHNGFMSRKFYFEVFVGQKTEWSLGVASGSIERRAAIPQSPDNGLWAIWFKKDRFETFCCPGVTVHSDTLERVGVFVDYDEGEVSFYDVEKAQLIFSFTECSFFEELYPYFNPCDNEYGANLDPLVIVPVGCSPDLQT
uniref:E3 ubiquitin-protein ligase TRIM21-like n=1 Tax=Cynoglossus semilaevis TaxID=244447 RepID=A0A3P8W1A2_CYNSE